MTAFRRRAVFAVSLSASLVFSSCTPLLYAQSPAPATSTRSIAPLLPQIEDYVVKGMQKTGVPGVAMAIVYQDKVVYLKGFGVRKAGEPAPVDADTVFQLASMSKPIASTVVAVLISQHKVSWDDRIAEIDPDFKLSNASVSEKVTIRDLLSHRSGLPTSAGDELETLGFSRPEILHQMRLIPLVGEFRKSYAYSNFGFTEGGIAPAKKVGESWEALSDDVLFKPLGMTSTSYRWSDYRDNANKAAIHIFVDGKAVPRYLRNPDAEAPAGSASSSVRDLAQWVRLQLAEGKFNDKQIIAADVLEETHSAQIQRGVSPATGKPSSYGIGWGVDHDSDGRLIVGHSGAFALGAGTTVQLSPSDHLGIIVLTNAEPTGFAEAVANEFFDLYHYGKEKQNWLQVTTDVFKNMIDTIYGGTSDYSKQTPPASPAAAKPLSTYTGIYRNDYYGQIEVSEDHGLLWMRLPADGSLFSLTHWDGDTFVYRYKEEPGAITRGVKFTPGTTPKVLLENLASEGDAVFTKLAP
jgi:CubicO group peptidase (beta-lactamase class C family)